jgi:RNA polymerase sigma-70 factor (ECF subfamily)
MYSTKYHTQTDDWLVQRLTQSDEKAFEAIYQRYWESMYRFAYQQTGSKEDAEHLVHDVFVSIWKRREALQIKNLGVYLTASVKHLTTNLLKSQITMRKYQEYLILKEIEQNRQVEDILYFDDLAEAVEQALKKLPEKTAEVFRLSRFKHQSNQEIAAHLHLSEKAVEYHITKSLQFLKQHLKTFQSDN